jgi:PBP1b-binding outer membrane lipoprotein LpoB
MKKKLIAPLLLAVFVLAGCAAHMHVVGEGAQGTEVVAARQFYVISLAPLNEVDTRAMAGGAEDYTIKTAAGFLDIVIATVTGGIITSRKVVVIK